MSDESGDGEELAPKDNTKGGDHEKLEASTTGLPLTSKSVEGQSSEKTSLYLPLVSKKQQLEADQKLSQYVPILPKPEKKISTPLKSPPPPRLRHFRAQKGCMVSFCLRPNCRLPTHLQRPTLIRDLERQIKSTSPRFSPSQVQVTADKIWAMTPTLITGGVDGTLTMPNEVPDTSLYRELFHDFCVSLYDRISALLEPPSVYKCREKQKMELRKSVVVAAMSKPVYFLNLIAAAHYYRGLRYSDNEANYRETTAIHGRLLALLRKELDDFHPTDAHSLVPGKTSTLDAHRRAMILLVDICGGVHRLGDALPYVLSLDRTTAIFSEIPPLYSQMKSPANSFARVPRHPKRYGGFFEDENRADVLNGDIRDYCMETCRAIEILEGEKWTFDPQHERNSSEIQYFYYLRDRLGDQFAHLNARHQKSPVLERCILLAAKIVEYVVLMDNYIDKIPLFLAGRLQALLLPQNNSRQWVGWNDAFLWVLFVLASLPNKPWDGRSWAVSITKDVLSFKYGSGDWPSNWIEIERSNIHRFVWVETRLKNVFEKSCSDIIELKQQ